MTRRLVVMVLAVVFLSACGSILPPTTTLPTGDISKSPPQTAVATVPEPSQQIAVACGPLAAERCQSALQAVKARVAPLGVASIAQVAIEPESSLLTCSPTGGLASAPFVCSVIAVVTFSKPGPLAIGLVLVSDRWTSSGATTGWWGSDGGRYCAAPAAYRVGGRVAGIGPCFGVLFNPPSATITLVVGQKLDLHMTVGGGHPFYPLPWSTSPAIVKVKVANDAATATYEALSPGTALLMTIGGCLPKANTPTGIGKAFTGSCPVAEVHVVPKT